MSLIRVIYFFVLVFVFASIGCMPRRPYDRLGGASLDRKKWTLIKSPSATQQNFRVKDQQIEFEMQSLSDPKKFGGLVNHLRIRSRRTKRDWNFFSATVKVSDSQIISCENDDSTKAFLRVGLGYFLFKDGPQTTHPIENDILAVIGISEDSKVNAGSLRAFTLILKCGDPCYFLNEFIPEKNPKSKVIFFEDLGPVAKDQPVNFGIRWQKEKKRVEFYRERNIVQTYKYETDDSTAPLVADRQLDIGHFVPSCKKSIAQLNTRASFSDIVLTHW